MKEKKYKQSTIYDFCTTVIDCTYVDKVEKKVRLKFARKPKKIQLLLFSNN
jgi:hypothetical protein